MERLARELGSALDRLDEDRNAPPVAWDSGPLCSPAAPDRTARAAHREFRLGPGHRCRHRRRAAVRPARRGAATGGPVGASLGTLTAALAPDEGHRIAAGAAADGRRPASSAAPVRACRRRWAAPGGAVETAGRAARRRPGARRRTRHVRRCRGGRRADLLPDGVFCVDRLGTIVYANPRAAAAAGAATGAAARPLRGRPCPGWTRRPTRIISAVRCCPPSRSTSMSGARPTAACGPRRSPTRGDWLAVSADPGPDLLTGTLRPANRVADASAGLTPGARRSGDGVRHRRPGPGPRRHDAAPVYRPILLAMALTEAVTARQVSAVVVRELLPAFGAAGSPSTCSRTGICTWRGRPASRRLPRALRG
ncbi:hypothetical protein LV779_26120 [Streptomyces thinghirensis]|nr:hypothetical protein [Streptomyces thinghirensis]